MGPSNVLTEFRTLSGNAQRIITEYLSSGKQGAAGDKCQKIILGKISEKLNMAQGDTDQAAGWLERHKATAHRAASALTHPNAAGLPLGVPYFGVLIIGILLFRVLY